jgi:hypothetical protein
MLDVFFLVCICRSQITESIELVNKQMYLHPSSVIVVKESERGEKILTWKIDVYRYADSSLIFGPLISSSESLKPDEEANFFKHKKKNIQNSSNNSIRLL